MRASRLKAATPLLAFGAMRQRLAMTCLMVLSILVAGFVNNSTAHAAFDGDKAVAEQTLDGKAPGSGLGGADAKAPYGKSFGGAADCTGHCASHTLSLAAPDGLLLAFVEPAAAWPARTATVVLMAAASRLDRPPRT